MYISLLHDSHDAAVAAITGSDAGSVAELVAPPAAVAEPIGELFPPMSYGEPFSPDIFVQRTDFTDGLHPLYAQLAHRAIARSVLHLLPRATVYNSVIWADTPEPLIVYETQRPNDRPAAPLPPATAVSQAESLLLDPNADHLLLTSAGSFNYGHFLVDDLPRLKALDMMSAQSPRRRRVVLMTSWGDAIDRVRAQAVAMIGGADVTCRFFAPHRAWRVGPVFYASPVSSHPITKHPEALRWAVDRVRRAMSEHDACDVGAERLYVARSVVHGRRLLNEPVVRASLESRGYQVVVPEMLSFAQQARLFAGAHHVVGQMGAAMTNLLFSRPGTIAVHLAPMGWIEPFYWDLAVALNQGYGALYGQPSGSDEPFHLRDFTIDPDALPAALPVL